MADKHLVLDPDVHAKLKRKKQQSGMTVRQIGNHILRSILSHPPVSEMIGEKLITTGKLAREEYERVTAEVTEEIKGMYRQVANLIRVTPERTLVCGSWEGREVWRSPDGAFQVLEGWARDERKEPISPHCHEQHQFIIVLAGRVQARTETEDHILEPLDSLYIPAGQAHSNAPLTRDAREVIITIPAASEYMVGS